MNKLQKVKEALGDAIQLLEQYVWAVDSDKVDSIKESLKELNEFDYYDSVIDDICTNFYQPLIDNFKEMRKHPDVGAYAHENDIQLYERLQVELRAQEWRKPK